MVPHLRDPSATTCCHEKLNAGATRIQVEPALYPALTRLDPITELDAGAEDHDGACTLNHVCALEHVDLELDVTAGSEYRFAKCDLLSLQ
jgi:hypothetical protein